VLTPLQLAEATASLVLKTGTISDLETQVGELKVSLNNITADKELAEARDALVVSRGDGHNLEQVSDEVRPN